MFKIDKKRYSIDKSLISYTQHFNSGKNATLKKIISYCSNTVKFNNNIPSRYENHEFVLSAVTRFGSALQYASNALKNNKTICLAAVKQDGRSYFHVADQLKDSFDVCYVAVCNNGSALKYAPEFLRNNSTIVRAAINNFPIAIKYIGSELEKDYNLALLAVKKNWCTI